MMYIVIGLMFWIAYLILFAKLSLFKSFRSTNEGNTIGAVLVIAFFALIWPFSGPIVALSVIGYYILKYASR